MVDAESVKKDACTKVEELISNNTSLGDSSQSGGPSNSNYSPTLGSLASSSTASTQTAAANQVNGSTVDSDRDGIFDSKDLAPFVAARAAEAVSRSPILRGSPELGALAIPKALALDRKAVMRAATEQGAAATVAGIAAAAGASPQAQQAIAGLAQLGENARGALGVTSAATFGGGGGRSGGSGGGAKAEPSGFASLFAGKAAGPLATGMDFGARDPAAIEATDVFHTGTSKSLFQIVSDRVRAVEPRLK